MYYKTENCVLCLALLAFCPIVKSIPQHEIPQSELQPETEELEADVIAEVSESSDEVNQAGLKLNKISSDKNDNVTRGTAASCANNDEDIEKLKRQVTAFRAKLLTDATKHHDLMDLITAYEAQIDENIATISAQQEQIEYLNSTIVDFRNRSNNLDVEILDLQVIARAEAAKLKQRDNQLADCRAKIVKSEASSCLAFGNSSDIQILNVPGLPPFLAACESRFEGSGWTVIQRRLDGSVNFNRSWNEYKAGFGDLREDFFIGLEKLHRMTTAQPHELLVYLQAYDYTIKYFIFSKFVVGSEATDYKLLEIESDNSYDDNNGKSFLISRKQKFTTYDRDNDNYWLKNCAKENNGGWWFKSCDHLSEFANLNGIYGQFEQGIMWSTFDRVYSLKSAQMMIRPKKAEKA